MIRFMFRTVLLLAVLVGAGAIAAGWRPGPMGSDTIRDAVGTTGVNADRARQVGAQVAERTVAAADQARTALADGSVTAKIKAKIALDDTLKGADVSVNTDGTTVTMSGLVGTRGQRDRVLQLARETEGVSKVVDKLKVR
jgi:osmotically-inducible protein OsmY